MTTDKNSFEFRTGPLPRIAQIVETAAMGQNVSSTLRLDQIQDKAQVSEGKASQLLDTCIWCLLYCKHSNGVVFKILAGNETAFYAVAWLFLSNENTWSDNRIDVEAIKRSYNKDDAIEDGAEAIAFLLSIERTTYTAVERASTKTGIDYWLGFKDRNPNEPFHRAGRLEISGIMNENPRNKVDTRVNEKLGQTTPTDHTFPVYVIVVEFSKPYATMVLKNANR